MSIENRHVEIVHDRHDELYGPTRRHLHERIGSAPEVPQRSEAPEQEPARSVPEPPPLGGPGSGRDAWAGYAEDVLGLAVTDDMNRDDIVVLVRQHEAGG